MERRNDTGNRDRIHQIDRRLNRRLDKISDRLAKAMLIFGIANVVALGLGFKALDNNGKRIDDINHSREENIFRICAADSDKNGVIRKFILFSVRGDQRNKLFVEAKKVFPVRDKAACEAEATEQVNAKREQRERR